MSSERQDGERGSAVRPIELAIGVLSGLVVLGVLGLLGYQGVAVRDAPPDLHSAVVRVEGQRPPYVVQVRVRNDGGETAQGVQIAGELTRDGRTVEQASATVRYLPPNSQRSVSLLFTTDPGTADVSVKAAGYTRP